MKKIANAAPALFCLVNLAYPVCALLTRIYGLRKTAFLYPILPPVVAVLSMILGSIWFVFSKEDDIDVNIVHVIFAAFAPVLSFINGVYALNIDSGFWTLLSVILTWIEAVHIPMGCFSLASGKRLRSILMLVACAVMLLNAIPLVYPRFAQDLFTIALIERIF